MILRKSAIPALLLRIGLAFVLLYAAVSQLMHPFDWTGYLPAFAASAFQPRALVTILAAYNILLAGWLLSGKLLRYAALLCAVTLAGIALLNLSQLIVTFRDIGLVCAALALAFLAW